MNESKIDSNRLSIGQNDQNEEDSAPSSGAIDNRVEGDVATEASDAAESEVASREAEEAVAEGDELPPLAGDEVMPAGEEVGVFGRIYRQFKGKAKEAIHKLFSLKSGEAKGVFHRKEIGDIGLIWGDNKKGLQHIINKHIITHSDFNSISELLSTLEDVITNGVINNIDVNGNIRIDKDGKRVVIAKNNEGDFVLTAYDNSRTISNKKRSEADATLFDQRITEEMNGALVSSDLASEDKGSENILKEQADDSSISRIPVDSEGNPLYEAVDSDTAWDAIIEQTEGDVAMAQSVVDSMVSDKEAALKKLQRSKSKGGATIAEKIASEKERQASIAGAEAELAKWRAIAGVSQRRAEEAEAERRRIAEEAEAERRRIAEEQKAERRRIAEEQKAERKAEEERLRADNAGSIEEEDGRRRQTNLSDTSRRQQNYSPQEEIDENGHPFVVSSDGTTSFGEIREESGLPAAPIKLSEGYQDENGKGYGLVHIEANHGEQIRNAGFASVEEFVSFVAKNYDEDNIRVGKRRDHTGSTTYLIQVTDEHDKTLFIELSRDGSYWNVNSGGIFRKGYSNKKETVVKTEPQQPNNAVSTGSSLSAEDKSGISATEPNGEPTVSESKDTTNSPTTDELGEKNVVPSVGEQVQAAEAEVNVNPTDKQKEAGDLSTISQESEQVEPTFAEEQLENGDKRIVGRNSRGEIASVAIERAGKIVSVDSYDEGVLFEHTDYDSEGKAMTVIRYDKSGAEVSRRDYIAGKRAETNGERIRRLSKDERAKAQRKALEGMGIYAEVSLPRGAKWSDGKKFGQKSGRKQDSTQITALVAGDDLYIKGVGLPWTNRNRKNHDVYVIRNFRSWSSIGDFKVSLMDNADMELTNSESDAINSIFTDNGIGFNRRITRPIEKQQSNEQFNNSTDAQQLATESVLTALRNGGIEVIEASDAMVEEVLGEQNAEFSKKKRAFETASVQKEHQPTVVSNADGAKVLKNLDTTAREYEEKSNQSKTFLGDLANALGANKHGSNSQYATFETVNGKIVTIRLSNHNATVSNFDNNNETDGISIVVSAKENQGIINDGEAHVVEYYYDAINLRKADGKPLAEIVKSIKQALYSGEFVDTTGLAERQEVNLNAPQFSIGLSPKGVFYSNARKAVAEIKQDKATPQQWIAMLKKSGGLKAGEDAWLGLEEWLNQQNGSVSKQDILEYIDSNTIEIEEVSYSDEANEVLREMALALRSEYEGLISGGMSAEEAWASMEERYGEVINEAIEGGTFAIKDVEYALDLYYYIYGEDLVKDDQAINSTRLDYTTEGLKNNREIALTVPTVEAYNTTDAIHFGDAGEGTAVAWIRFGETTDTEGNRVLVIDEIQSKRHQDGREKGNKHKDYSARASEARASYKEAVEAFDAYRTQMLEKYGNPIIIRGTAEERREARRNWKKQFTIEELTTYDTLHDRQTDARLKYEKISDSRTAVPVAPFEKNWQELAMKRMLRYAAENGFAKVAWTTGEQQAKRYDIGNSVSVINRDDTGILVETTSGDISIDFDNEGKISTGQFSVGTLSDVFGKEIADKILNMNSGESLSTSDLHIGGEGMKGFYDRMLPSFMNKYGKKWGVKVGEVTMPGLAEGYQTMHSVEVTSQMRDDVMQGQPMFFRTPRGVVYGWTIGGKIYLTPHGMNPNTPIHEYTHLWANAMMQRNPKGWESVKTLLRGTPIWTEVMMDSNYSEIQGNEDLVASECLSRLSGSQNAKKMESIAERMLSEAKSVGAKADAIGMIERMKRALQKFWNWVGTNLFEIAGFDSIEQVTDRVLYDLLSGTDMQSGVNKSDDEVFYRSEEEGRDTTMQNKSMQEVAEEAEQAYNEHFQHGNRADVVRINSEQELLDYFTSIGETEESSKELLQIVKEREIEGVYYEETDKVIIFAFESRNAYSTLFHENVHRAIAKLGGVSHFQKLAEELKQKDKKLSKRVNESYKTEEASEEMIAYTMQSALTGNSMKYLKDSLTSESRLLIEQILHYIGYEEGRDTTIDVGRYERRPLEETFQRERRWIREVYERYRKENERGIPSERETSRTQQATSGGDKGIEDTVYRDWYGGNSGYVGYSKSTRAVENVAKHFAPEIKDDVNPLTEVEQLEAELRGLWHDMNDHVRGAIPTEAIPTEFGAREAFKTSEGYYLEVVGNQLTDSKPRMYAYGPTSENGDLWVDEWWEFKNRAAYERAVAEFEDVKKKGLETIPAELRERYEQTMTERDSAFERQIEASRGREGDGAVTGSTSDRVAMRGKVDELSERLGVEIEMLEDGSGLSGKKSKAKGFFNPKTGKVTIILGNNRDLADVEQTVLHEAVAHYGLRQLFGEHFDRFLDNIYEHSEPSIRRAIDELAKRRGYSLRTATEEYLAKLAEDSSIYESDRHSWLHKVRAFFRDMLRALGFKYAGDSISFNEIRYILWRSYENLTERGGGLFGEAKDVSMQHRLGVGEYAYRGEDSDTGETQQIIDEAKKNGTYMKAPNGKPTKLNEKQWAQVRTEAFKKWFGDWELANLYSRVLIAWNDKNSKGKAVFGLSQRAKARFNELLGNGAKQLVITDDSIRHIKNEHGVNEKLRGQKDMTPEDVVIIPYLINNFDSMELAPEYNDKLGNKAVTITKRINGVSVVATIERGKNKEFLVSSYQFIKSDALNASNEALGLNVRNDSDIANIQKEIETIKFKSKNSSKVVDENGEPMVVYHSGNEGITTFSRNFDKQGIGRQFWGKGFYFGTAKSKDEWSRRYKGKTGKDATQYATFLNIRKPSYSPINGEVKDSEYDGVILLPQKTVEGETDYMFIVASSSQIKSATDNVGTFDENNENIFYREGEENERESIFDRARGIASRLFGRGRRATEAEQTATEEPSYFDPDEYIARNGNDSRTPEEELAELGYEVDAEAMQREISSGNDLGYIDPKQETPASVAKHLVLLIKYQRGDISLQEAKTELFGESFELSESDLLEVLERQYAKKIPVLRVVTPAESKTASERALSTESSDVADSDELPPLAGDEAIPVSDETGPSVSVSEESNETGSTPRAKRRERGKEVVRPDELTGIRERYDRRIRSGMYQSIEAMQDNIHHYAKYA